MTTARSKINRLLLAATVLLAAGVAAPAAAQLNCFPSCAADDGRVLVIASGAGLDTLSGRFLDIEFAAPAGTSSFQIGVFDGDTGRVDGQGKAHWDVGNDIPYSYTLYADPLADNSGTAVVASFTSADMADNAWTDFTVVTSPAAQSPSGNYFYRLRVELVDSAPLSLNAFKVRTTGFSSIKLVDQPFSYQAAVWSLADAMTIYPAFPALVPTTYDGTFSFFFELLEPATEVAVWDGDFDRGNWDGSLNDTDDPDTPNAPFLPSFVTGTPLSEGVAVGLAPSTGNPADDGSPVGAVYVRSPAIEYEVRFPDGQVFVNTNPSGNREWEQFRVSTDPFDATQMDYTTSSVPAGTYEMRINGADLSNLNAVRLPGRALCLTAANRACTPLYPYLVGDTVFRDLDGNGLQSGPGEVGIAGVLLELVGPTGWVIKTTTTDANGHYDFGVYPGSYTVRVAASNSAPGGPLDGTVATTPVEQSDSVVDDNVLTYDFGYRGTGSLGDRLWIDSDGDGVQDPGEAGINGATVELLDAAGNVLGSTTTSGDGLYTFDHLFPGAYTVRVRSSTLPAGVTPSYDLDGVGSPHSATLTLGAGQRRTDVDFGYRPAPAAPGTGTLGYWKTHPEAWPVASIVIGGRTYTKAQAISLMSTPSRGDKSIDMFHQLVAAKLNALVGNETSCIAATISAADGWMASYPAGSRVKGSSSAWAQASGWHTQLDDYNNGRLCAPHRD